MSEPTRADRLTAARDRLVLLLSVEEDGSKAASLSRELRAVEAELVDLAPSAKGATVDDLAAQREARLANAAGSDKAAGSK